MRRYMSLLAVLAVFVGSLALPTAAYAGGWVVVNGGNDAVCGDAVAADGFTCDAERLQAAVDEGGKIKLRGTFDLGDPTPGTARTVFITQDVNIKGQDATIRGGYNTFTIGIAGHFWAYDAFFDWAFVEEPRVPVAVSIKNVTFDNWLNTAIYDLASTNLTIKHNRFVDGMSVYYSGPPNPGAPSSYAVLVSTAAQFMGAPTVHEDVSGKVTIVGNYIDGMGREEAGGIVYEGSEWKGLRRAFNVTEAAADVTIRDNQVRNVLSTVIVLDGVKGRSLVTDNDLSNAAVPYEPEAQMFQVFEPGWGLLFGVTGVDPAESTTIIRDNEIVANHLVGSAFAVFDSDAVVIKDNDISFTAGVTYDVFYLAGTNDSVIKDNEISGYGPDILWLEASSGNVFKDNDTEDFSSSDVDFFADAFSFDNKTYLEEDQTYFDGGNNIWIFDD